MRRRSAFVLPSSLLLLILVCSVSIPSTGEETGGVGSRSGDEDSEDDNPVVRSPVQQRRRHNQRHAEGPRRDHDYDYDAASGERRRPQQQQPQPPPVARSVAISADGTLFEQGRDDEGGGDGGDGSPLEELVRDIAGEADQEGGGDGDDDGQDHPPTSSLPTRSQPVPTAATSTVPTTPSRRRKEEEEEHPPPTKRHPEATTATAEEEAELQVTGELFVAPSSQLSGNRTSDVKVRPRFLGAKKSRRKSSTTRTKSSSPNLLVIVLDQLRFDVLGFVQRGMKEYDGKVKVRTPNIDELARSGAVFETAYCIAPSCAPSRTGMKTGASLQRAAIKGNRMIKPPKDYRIMPMTQRKVAALKTFEQILSDKCGYKVESYGKWHVPMELYYSRKYPNQRAVRNNFYDFKWEKPMFSGEQVFKPFYVASLRYLLEKDNDDTCKRRPEGMQQKNYFSDCWYTPIQVDPRYGSPKATPLREKAGFQRWQIGNSKICGRDALGPKYTSTAVLAKMALKALERLAAKENGTPWSLSINFNAPHPPMVATGQYMKYYWEKRERLYVSPSIRDPMLNSAYRNQNGRDRLSRNGYNRPTRIAELTAVYYALVQEVDHWVGKILEKLDALGERRNTLVIFTSDHGEQLGAHSMLGKGILLEESTRVPLILSFPGKIPSKSVVKSPVSHIDMFRTIFDYLGRPELGKSDGRSLRRFIDKRSYNKYYDEKIAVVEMDQRIPVGPDQLSGKLGGAPTLMIRKGSYKLILPKKEDSDVLDMMYDLKNDPLEMHNLLGKNGDTAKPIVIGKAEYLKCLLTEWMRRVDGKIEGYYSDNKYNLGEGRGDIREIRARRTWREVEYWQSHEKLIWFGQPVYVASEDSYRRNEYLYIGRTKPGVLTIKDISVTGVDARYFSVSTDQAVVNPGSCFRVRVSFESKKQVSIGSLDASIRIQNDVDGVRKIKIVGPR